MSTNCAPLIADLSLFCYEWDFLMSPSNDKQADIIDPFNTIFRHLDDILNINNVCYDNMVRQILPFRAPTKYGLNLRYKSCVFRLAFVHFYRYCFCQNL